MWSLPNIVRMNDEAAEAAQKRQYEKEAARPEQHNCEVCEWHGEERAADYGYCWYDIFSDDPKGTIFLCEEHDGYTGSPMEGYFQCGECDRVFIENYSWEIYSTVVDCEQLCLPCALKRYLNDPSNWIPTYAVQSVILDPNADEDNSIFDSATGELNLAKARHLIGVEMPVPDTLTFIENLEFDSATGEMLATTSSTFPGGVGESRAMRAIDELKEQGYEKFLLILDAGYQFSVSMGLYVDSAEHRRIQGSEQAEVQLATQVVA